MRYLVLTAVLLCCSVVRGESIDLWAPIGGEYRFEVDGEVYAGEYLPTYSNAMQERFEIDVAGVWNGWAWIDAGHYGVVTATVRADQPAVMEGWFDFTSPDGYSFTTSRHPTAGTAATGFALDGVPLEYGKHTLVTPGTHRLSYALSGQGVGGANLQVWPVPEPSAAVLLLGGLLVLVVSSRRT